MRFAALLASGLLLGLVGCSSTEAGTPASSATAPPDPIPAVQNPKDVSGTAPCDLLTPEQLASLGIDQPGAPSEFEYISGNPSCVWRDTAETRDFSTGVFIDAEPLRNTYLYQRNTYAVFELMNIAGHPVILTQDIAGGGSCTLLVKTSDQQAFNIRFTSLGQDEAPCSEAQRIVETILGNLPPAA